MLVEAVVQSEDVSLGAAIVLPDSTLIGVDVGELVGLGKLGVSVVGHLSDVVHDFDVLIDFTSPDATLANAALCAVHGKKLVVGTTGFAADQEAPDNPAPEWRGDNEPDSPRYWEVPTS